jgi:UPF0755 protein
MPRQNPTTPKSPKKVRGYLRKSADKPPAAKKSAVKRKPTPEMKPTSILKRYPPKLLAVCAGLVLIGFFALFLLFFGIGLSRPLTMTTSSYSVEVTPGMTLWQIADKMDKDGVLSHRWLLTIPARAQGISGSIKIGRYRFEEGVTPNQVLHRLAVGAMVPVKITLLEGTNFAALKALLRKSPDIKNTVLDLPDAEILKRIGATEKHPEGLFFPDTYQVAPGSSDLALLRKMYQEMHIRLEDAWESRRAGLPLASPYEALILASIVEKETNHNGDRPYIASVLINRLKRGMRLQADPTVIYGMGETYQGNIRRRDLTADTPYNTYVRSGLPPTPITSVSQASLDAVLQAPDSKYLYFVARGDGTSEFSENLNAHNNAVNKFIRKKK